MLHEGEPVRILGNTLTEGFGEETLRTLAPGGEPRYTLCDIDYTSEDGWTQTHARVNRRTDRRCACATADFERVSAMKLVPHEHAQMTQKTAEFLQPQFINKVVHDRVKVQRQVPQSDEMQQSRYLRIQFSEKWRIPVVQQRTDATRAVPESSEEDRASTVTACKGRDAIQH